MSSETSRTGRTSPRAVSKAMFRPVISSSGSGIRWLPLQVPHSPSPRRRLLIPLPQLRVERIAQSVADKVEGYHRDKDERARPEHPRVLLELGDVHRLLQHITPRGDRLG